MEYTVIRSRRKSVSLQITNTGSLVVRVPRLYPRFSIEILIAARKNWIDRNLAKIKANLDFTPQFSNEELKNYKKNSKQILLGRLNTISEKIKISYNELRISSAKTRWGSCTSQGTISLNWKLLLIPESICNYVIIHELAHRIEMNHSLSFWKIVEQFDPNYKQHRQTLRAYGNLLNQY